jgi:hypothetical protein
LFSDKKRGFGFETRSNVVGHGERRQDGRWRYAERPKQASRSKARLSGEAFGFAFGDALAREGSYRIVLTDAAGNAAEYSFEIVYAGNAVGTAVITAAHI